jgi:hypothetical protein
MDNLDLNEIFRLQQDLKRLNQEILDEIDKCERNHKLILETKAKETPTKQASLKSSIDFERFLLNNLNKDDDALNITYIDNYSSLNSSLSEHTSSLEFELPQLNGSNIESMVYCQSNKNLSVLSNVEPMNKTLIDSNSINNLLMNGSFLDTSRMLPTQKSKSSTRLKKKRDRRSKLMANCLCVQQ